MLGLAIVGFREHTPELPLASNDFEDCPSDGVRPPRWVIVQSPGAYVQCSQATAHSGSWSVLVRGEGNYGYAYRKSNFFDVGRGDKNLTVSGYLRFESFPIQDPRIFFLAKLFHSHLVVYNPDEAVAFGASFVGTTDLLAWRQDAKRPCFPWCTSPITVPLSQHLEVGIWYEVWMRLTQEEEENLIEYRVTDLSTGKVIAYKSTKDFVPQAQINRIDIGYDQDGVRAGFADSANTYYDSVEVEASGSAASTQVQTLIWPPTERPSSDSSNQGSLEGGSLDHILINEVELNPQVGMALPFVVLANPSDHSVSFQRLEMKADTGGSVSYWQRDQASVQSLTRSIWDPPTKNTTVQITLYLDGAEADRTPALSDPWADNRTWQRRPDGSWIFAVSTSNLSEFSSASVNISHVSRLTESANMARTVAVPAGRPEGYEPNQAYSLVVRYARMICEAFCR